MNLIHKLFDGVFWSTLGKWTVTIFSTVLTFILARLLTPEDFGIVAIAALVVALFDIISKMGTTQYIIKETNPSVQTINTAWTIQLISKFIVSFLVLLSAFFIDHFVNDIRIKYVLLTLAIVPIFDGLSNIGIVLLTKELKIRSLTIMQIIVKLIYCSLTLLLAFKLQNYWAFIIGSVAESLFRLIGSYLVSSYRPKFDLSQLKRQFSFSKWTFLKAIVNYTSAKSAEIVVAKGYSASMLGEYSLAQRILFLPSELFLSPFTDMAFPALSMSLDNKAKFKMHTEYLLCVIVAITMPMTMLLFLEADEIVYLALGDLKKWSNVSEIISIMAITLVFASLNANMFGIQTLLNNMRLLFIFELVMAISKLSIFIGIIFYSDSIFTLVWATVIFSIISFIFMTFVTYKATNIDIVFIAYFSFALLCITCFCLYISHLLNGYLSPQFGIVSFIVKAVSFSLLYIVITANLFKYLGQKYNVIKMLNDSFIVIFKHALSKINRKTKES